MDSEQIAEINRLRALNLSPKQIARKLSLRPADVAAVIKGTAEQINTEKLARGERYPLIHCKMTADAAAYFFGTGQQDAVEEEMAGITQVIILRQDGNSHQVTTYLVDYWCLGVKDAREPHKMHLRDYEAMERKMEMVFEQPFVNITLEQAQAIVFGAVDYAASLGFNPHRDFAKAKEALGPKLEPLAQLEFGKNGKPFYINGPYDNPNKIIATLIKSVGEGNFDSFLQGPPM